MADRPTSLVDRFWVKVDTTKGPHSCWPWTCGTQGRGYGQFYLAKRQPIGAHRFAYELAHGPIPDGMHVCHRCDNPPCCNPTHLFVGTAADNMRDKTAKGRNPGNRTVRGRRQFAIRGQDLIEAVAMVASGHTQRAVAAHFGVSPAAVCRALQAACHPISPGGPR